MRAVGMTRKESAIDAIRRLHGDSSQSKEAILEDLLEVSDEVSMRINILQAELSQ